MTLMLSYTIYIIINVCNNKIEDFTNEQIFIDLNDPSIELHPLRLGYQMAFGVIGEEI